MFLAASSLPATEEYNNTRYKDCDTKTYSGPDYYVKYTQFIQVLGVQFVYPVISEPHTLLNIN